MAGSQLPRPNADDDDWSHFDDLISFVEQALAAPLASGRDILIVAVPAPSDAPERFLRLVPRDMGMLWRSPHGKQIAGGGCVHRIEADGENRLKTLAGASREFFSRVQVRSAEGLRVVPTLFGGLSFSPDVPPIEPWADFGSASLSLPRWCYGRENRAAYLSVAVTAEEGRDPAVRAQFVKELRHILVTLETEPATSLIERHETVQKTIHHISAGDWNGYIAAIQDAIATGGFDKIVAARRCTVDLATPVDDTGFMARLFAAYPDCTHFAIRRGDATFLGATPETLFCKEGRRVRTHALAGTTRVKDDAMYDSSEDAAALRRSYKDLAEHALVVKKICEELWPLCARLRYSSTPEARRVRNLVHLQTPISAEVRPEVDAFRLLAALHPTPAVGGFPAREAAEWIRNNEPQERGWYTGTVGWCDAEGNAEFAVSIRCGVLTPKRAYVYAGAGIVKASDADSEYRETGAKMHPLLRALGLDNLQRR